MPELPEVEIVRRGLNAVTLHQEIQGGDVILSRTVAFPATSTEFIAGLVGRTIAQWERRGKYLLAELVQASTGQAAGWLGVHLRMTGQLLWTQPEVPLQKHTRVRLLFAEQRELRFVDQRTFGQMWWVPPGQLLETVITGLTHLGPEPFSPDFSTQYFRQRLQRCDRPIKNALLDQDIVAGIGNIYADEALFLAKIRPQTKANQLSPAQIEGLRAMILQVLQASIAVGGTTFSTFLSVQGINGNYGGIAQVYNREDQPCSVCHTPIQRLKLAGRSAHFCPLCQS